MADNVKEVHHYHGPAPLKKSHKTAVLLSIFLGGLGVDRFYLGQVGLGIAKIAVNIFTLTIGGFIWWIIDIIMISTRNVRGVEWTD